jgi:hypothetical protein
MRWAPQHVNPMLSLRNLVCNKRWNEGWQQIVTHHQQQRRKASWQSGPEAKLGAPKSLTLAALEKQGLLPPNEDLKSGTSEEVEVKQPDKDHPWRRGFWPTKESWRWN